MDYVPGEWVLQPQCKVYEKRIGKLIALKDTYSSLKTPLIQEGSCQFLAKECVQVHKGLTQKNVWLGKLTALDMTLTG